MKGITCWQKTLEAYTKAAIAVHKQKAVKTGENVTVSTFEKVSLSQNTHKEKKGNLLTVSTMVTPLKSALS